MRQAGLKRQTMLLTLANAIVRALGLFMRVVFSRALGAEIMGVAELASGVHMLAISFLTSGLPLAISRMTAKAKEGRKEKPLAAGLHIVRRASALMIPALLLLSPVIARLSGDERILPSLWFSAPCVMILGYSAAYNGYCYGTERGWIAAVSELIEQGARVGVSLILLFCVREMTAAWSAAIPAFATMVAEIMGLLFVLLYLRTPMPRDYSRYVRPVASLAAPATATRLISTALRSVTSILIPMRLQASGLPPPEATSRLGMLSGMVMPIIMLPCIFTSALSMVMLPRLAKAEGARGPLKRLTAYMALSSLAVGALCSLAVYACAPLLSVRVYGLAELASYFRAASPLAVVISLTNTFAGIVAGLGMQKKAMYGSLASSAITLLATFVLTSIPSLRLFGAIIAMTLGHIATLVWNGVIIRRSISGDI